MPQKKTEGSVDDLMDQYLEAFNKLANLDTEEEPETIERKPDPKFKSGPEFGCLHCKEEFGRVEKAAPKKCPKCKSDAVYKRWELISDEAKSRKYEPDFEEQLIGPKQSKYFGYNQVKAAWRGKKS